MFKIGKCYRMRSGELAVITRISDRPGAATYPVFGNIGLTSAPQCWTSDGWWKASKKTDPRDLLPGAVEETVPTKGEDA